LTYFAVIPIPRRLKTPDPFCRPDVTVVGDYRLILTFEGNEKREIDLGALLSFTGIFEPLKDPDYFRKVRVEPDV